jgi:hypothetical protein
MPVAANPLKRDFYVYRSTSTGNGAGKLGEYVKMLSREQKTVKARFIELGRSRLHNIDFI